MCAIYHSDVFVQTGTSDVKTVSSIVHQDIYQNSDVDDTGTSNEHQIDF